ncbi:MAG TPA: hypothetical protein VFX49_07850, partial [Chloroflexota bacterium]|nr:hypothetical protein [Chloroflexota bacterium]
KESLDEKQIREVTGLTQVKTDTPSPDSAEAMAQAVHSAAADAATVVPPEDATVAPGSPESTPARTAA